MPALNGTSVTVENLIRFSLIALLAIVCFKIITPFIVPVVWGLIIAVAIKPLHAAATHWLGGNSKLSAILIALIFVAALLGPSIVVGVSSVSGVQDWFEKISSGHYKLPDLPSSVATWPLVGEPVSTAWTQAQENLSGVIQQYDEQLRSLMSKAGGTVGSLIGGILQFTFSIIIAAIFWVSGPRLKTGSEILATKLIGSDGPEYLEISRQTIQSVAKGVIGVALIQAVASAIGLVAAGVPAAGLWAALVLIVAVAQLPPILVLGPIAAWLYGQDSNTTATLFLIWSLVVSASDAFLKPMLLGRGVKIPMVVILIGALGGMMAMGILGLFVGAVVLGVAYEITVRWASGKTPMEAEA